MSIKIGMVSLGCPKNQTDAEIMLSIISKAGYEITGDETEADAIIVNTCGFIADAKAEAIENILELAEQKSKGNLKALIVTGCLAERYKDEIIDELPEVDAVVGIGANRDIVSVIEQTLKGEKTCLYAKKEDLLMDADRILTTPKYSAYLRISDGCDNCCTYCAIPKIRGRFRSREMESIIEEAKTLAKNGAKEITLIAQDTTRYGQDLYGEPRLAELLEELDKIDGIKWIRMLYTYPDLINDKLLLTIKNSKRILHYLDIPMQHASESVLKNMNREGNPEKYKALINHIREVLPDVTIRTTMMVGFPGETDEDFETLAEFIKAAEFDRMGCFAYSAEEGTMAATMSGQVDEQIKENRKDILYTSQSFISEKRCSAKIGTTQEVLVEGYDSLNKCYYGRSKADAPEIDGKVFFTSKEKILPGVFTNVQITDIIDYDLIGERSN